MLKKKILIFDNQIDGHHLEYIHHLYTKALQHSNLDFLFVLPEDFLKVKNQFQWSVADNIHYYYIKRDELQYEGNLIAKSYRISRFVYSLAKKNCVSHVFFITLMMVLPSIVLVFPPKIKVSGIIYQIYLYRWKKSSLKVRMEDIIKYIFLSRSSVFKTIYILNDLSASVYLNKKFNTSKFLYLPDPFISLPDNNLCNLKEKLRVPQENKIILHFGAIAKRKGSLNILKALSQCEENDLDKLSFVFAGEIDKDIKLDFYRIVEEIKDKVHIIIYDEFCSYEFLASLCFTSDFLLIPYITTSQSSGVIGYAAQFQKPVVAPKQGLLGKLVRKNKLGILIPDSSATSIKSFITNINHYKIGVVNEQYNNDRTINHFNDIIFSQFNV